MVGAAGLAWTILIVLVVIFIISVIITIKISDRKPEIKEAILSVQAIFTVFALMIAGYWYIIERRGAAHADLSLELKPFTVDTGLVDVEAILAVKNLGTGLLSLDEMDARIQQIEPSKISQDEFKSLRYDKWPIYLSDNKTPMFSVAEMMWPLIRQYHGRIDHHIEPGETDIIVTSFIISCKIKLVKVLFSVKKVDSGPLRWTAADGLWWKSVAYVSTSAACPLEKKTIK